MKWIVIGNLFFILIELAPLMTGVRGEPALLSRYGAVLGLTFSVLSAAYLFLRTFDLLRPEVVEEGLAALVRRDLVRELEQEQLRGVADEILAEECASWGIEYSRMDWFRDLPAIRSAQIGRVVDVDLNRLTHFARSLIGNLPAGGEQTRRARVVAGLFDEIASHDNVLCRISTQDNTPMSQRRLRQAFRIKEYVSR